MDIHRATRETSCHGGSKYLGEEIGKEPKKRKQADVAGMMESYIAMKTKQAEE